MIDNSRQMIEVNEITNHIFYTKESKTQNFFVAININCFVPQNDILPRRHKGFLNFLNSLNL
jgi:hypothetical protein